MVWRMHSRSDVHHPIRVALLGYGLAGRYFHAPLIKANSKMEIRAIVTADPDRRQQAATEHPTATIYDSAEQVWMNSADFDLAVIATANAAHVPQAEAALRSGLAVVVDKPLAATAAEGEILMALAESVERPLHVFMNRRWDSEFLTAQQAISDGLLGRVHRLESRFDRWRPIAKGGWRETGGPQDMPGLLFDLGSHLVDQALALLGPVEKVVASMRTVRDGVSGDDDTQVLLWHVDGGVSLLIMSAISAFTEPRLRILGTRGGLEIARLDGQEDALRAGLSPNAPDWGEEPAEAAAWLVDSLDAAPRPVPRLRGAWPLYYAGVAATILDGAAPPVDGRDVLANLRVIEAAQQAAREGITVALDPPAGHVSHD